MRWILVALLWVVATPASAQQIKWDINKGGGQWAFTTVWKGADGKRHKAQFTLPAEPIKEDLAEPLYWNPNKIAKVAARDINEHDFGKGKNCKATVEKGGLTIHCTGKTKDKQQAAYDKAGELYEARRLIWLDRHGFTILEDGTVAIDWARHILDFSDDLAPVVEGLGGRKEDPRVFAAKALSFVQTIPYEDKGKKAGTYRRPLSLLGRNRGDCDSKTVLFLALMHQAYPELGLGLVLIKGHAFGAIAFGVEDGDTLLRVDDDKWVGVEPVGPALFELGQIGRGSKRALRRRRYRVIRAT